MANQIAEHKRLGKCLSIHLLIYLCPSVCLSIHLCPSVCLSIHLCLSISVRLSLFVYLFISVCLSIYLSICPSIHPSVEAAIVQVNEQVQYEDPDQSLEALQNENLSLSSVNPDNIQYYMKGLQERLKEKREEV